MLSKEPSQGLFSGLAAEVSQDDGVLGKFEIRTNLIAKDRDTLQDIYEKNEVTILELQRLMNHWITLTLEEVRARRIRFWSVVTLSTLGDWRKV